MTPEIHAPDRLELFMAMEARKLAGTILPMVVLVFVWLVLAMFYFEAFPPPFERAGDWVIPWRQMFSPAAGTSLHGRLAFN